MNTTTDYHEELSAIHYDMYKEVYGVRPRWYDYDSKSVEEIKADLDMLAHKVEEMEAAREAAEKVAIERFENQVQSWISIGAGDRETAIRWIHDAEETDGDNDYLCYKLDLPYGYLS